MALVNRYATTERIGDIGGSGISGEEVDLGATDWVATVYVPRFLIVGTAGTLKVDFFDGGTGITVNVPAGYNPLRVVKIYKVGTSADGITVHD
jgi:hypothetical protein